MNNDRMKKETYDKLLNLINIQTQQQIKVNSFSIVRCVVEKQMKRLGIKSFEKYLESINREDTNLELLLLLNSLTKV